MASARQAESNGILSLDFGNESVKAIVSESHGDSLSCRQATIIPLPEKREETFLYTLISILKESLAPWSFARNRVRVSLSGSSITVRFIEVPRITKAQLLANIGYESSKYIPFALKDTYFDCDVFEPATDSKDAKCRAVIAAVKREAVADLAKILHGLGLAADLLDVSPIALLNAFERFGNPDPAINAFAVLDIGAQRHHLSIVVESVPAFSRELEIASPDAGGPGKAAGEKEGFSGLADEIRNSVAFLETQGLGSVGAVYVTGGGAMKEGLKDFLHDTLEIPVLLWNPFSSQMVQLGEQALAFKDRGPLFAVCLGLAAREGKP